MKQNQILLLKSLNKEVTRHKSGIRDLEQELTDITQETNQISKQSPKPELRIKELRKKRKQIKKLKKTIESELKSLSKLLTEKKYEYLLSLRKKQEIDNAMKVAEASRRQTRIEEIGHGIKYKKRIMSNRLGSKQEETGCYYNNTSRSSRTMTAGISQINTSTSVYVSYKGQDTEIISVGDYNLIIKLDNVTVKPPCYFYIPKIDCRNTTCFQKLLAYQVPIEALCYDKTTMNEQAHSSKKEILITPAWRKKLETHIHEGNKTVLKGKLTPATRTAHRCGH